MKILLLTTFSKLFAGKCQYFAGKGKDNYQWYQQKSSLVLKVPSAIIPKEHNFIINTAHLDFQEKSIKIVSKGPYFWDDRLID